jgi:hypothetical protein
MPFRPIEAASGRNSTEVSVSIKRFKGHASRLRVCFHERTVMAMGWKLGMQILPLVGDGREQGLVKLQVTDRKGFKLTRPPKSAARLNIVFPAPHGSPESRYSEAVEYHISTIDKTLTFRLPWVPKLRAIA